MEIIKYHKSIQYNIIYDELALNEINLEKNRYDDIVPLKSTSVRLKRIGSDPNTEYINANFVKDLEKEGFLTQLYISAQAPLPCTFNDFWRMAWEYNVSLILMLTNLVEDSSVKAEVYWPNLGKAIHYGDITVLCKKEDVKSSFLVLRYFSIWTHVEKITNNSNLKKSNGKKKV